MENERDFSFVICHLPLFIFLNATRIFVQALFAQEFFKTLLEFSNLSLHLTQSPKGRR
jgi:hypothetical protein